MKQLFDIALTFLYEMTRVKQSRYTKEDQASPLNLGITREIREKNQEGDENMAKMMTHINLLMNHVM